MGKIEIRDEIQIAKDPQFIWGILTDINSWRRWSGVVDRAVMYGPVKAGTAFKCLADQWDFDCIIVAAIPGEKFHCRGNTIGLEIGLRWQLSGASDGTQVLLAADIDGWMMHLIKGRIKREFEGAVFTWLNALKNYAERGSIRDDREKGTAISGRRPKRRLSLLRSFGLFPTQRRDDYSED